MSIISLRRSSIPAAIILASVLLAGAGAPAGEIQTVIERAKALYREYENRIEDMTIH